MKSFYLLVFMLLLLNIFSCSTKKNKTIQFKPVSENEFNFAADSSFAIPHGKIWDERKRIHDSCMEDSYAANAVFMRTKDTFQLGCIVNMKTMKVVGNIRLDSSMGNQLSPAINFMTKPCYEKRQINVSIDSFMNKKFAITIDSANEKINRELMTAIQNSYHTEIVTGSWINIEFTDALGKILDTTQNADLLQYKSLLLDSSNMVLMRSSSITEVSFYFHTKNSLPDDLKKKLMNKPRIKQPQLSTQLFYIDDNSFEITLNGFFQIVGQFMKCELQ